MKVSRLVAVIAGVVFVSALGAPSAAAVGIVVNDVSDTLNNPGCSTTGTGTCTLRDAITFANAHAGGDTITFAIAGSGVHTIVLDSSLPYINDLVTIDGYTQPGATPNTDAPNQGTNAVLRIEIDGTKTSAIAGEGGLVFGVGSENSIIRGLVINRCRAAGIGLRNGGASTIEGNFIGTDPTGTIDRGNGSGIGILYANTLTIGGATPAARNLVSGNDAGINFDLPYYIESTGSLVEGNLIGTNAAGDAALGNGVGIAINSSGSSNTFGGTTPAARNVISGNTGRGIALSNGLGSTGVSFNVVSGNYIGTDVTGTVAIPNGGGGIGIFGVDNTIGGTAAGAGNLISGNGGVGIEIFAADRTLVQGNKIGTDVTGTLPLGNASTGITVTATDVEIGGTAAGAANIIAFNGATSNRGGGVLISGNAAKNPVRRNAIYSNTHAGSAINAGLGIDIGTSSFGDGVTLNDAGDADTGANGLQNYPVITGISATAINGSLNSTPSSSFEVEFYASPACNGSGYGEGKTYLGTKTVPTNGTGNATFTFSVAVPAGQMITATATDSTGNTSEFSLCSDAVAVRLDPDPTAGAGSDGNGVFEPGETAEIQPVWFNPTGAPLSFTSSASALTGPAGATHTMTDTADAYAALPSGANGSCATSSNCFAGSVSDPATRPATHWDAAFTETTSLVMPPKNWTLHLGDSFTDVPRSQLFYKKIETIFHHGITVGCTPTEYCPSDKVPRSQMAIFIARGIQRGAALPTTGTAVGKPYNCVAGGTSAFTDVSPGAIFCKGVHFIAAKNVTGGCSTGHYCPDPNVTRSEMAIFMAKGVFAPAGGAAVPVTYGPDPVTGRSYSCDAGSPNLHFSDILTSDSYCKHVHYLWATGVIAGCSDTTYCPSQEVGRDEMAKFLGNAFQLELYGP